MPPASVMKPYKVRRSPLWPTPILTPIHALAEEGFDCADSRSVAAISASHGAIGEAPITAITFSDGVMFARGRVCQLSMSSEASSGSLPHTVFQAARYP